METIQDIITFMLILIPLAGIARGVACVVYMLAEEDPAPYKKRLRNVIIYTAVAECVTGLFGLMVSYLGGDVIF